MSMKQMRIEEKDIPLLIKNGKENEVIALLYKTIFPKVKNYIVKQNGRREDAYDIFQDAILYFYKQVIDGTFNDKYTVYGYLYKISINRWLNKIKKDHRLQLYAEFPEDFEAQSNPSGFDELILAMNNKVILDKILLMVGEKCKEILNYSICYNFMIEDIMVRMGFVSEAATKMQVKRCKEKLYKVVEENPELIKNLK